MLIYVLINGGMAVFTFLFGLYFYKSDGKAAKLLTGYNMKDQEERKKFDEKEMCRVYGKRMMVMAAPFVLGAVVDCFFVGLGSILAWGIYIILLIALIVERSKREKR